MMLGFAITRDDGDVGDCLTRRAPQYQLALKNYDLCVATQLSVD